jgi:excisionase family DNA binding protein
MRMTKKSQFSQRTNGHLSGPQASFPSDGETSLPKSGKSRGLELIEKHIPIGSSAIPDESWEKSASDEWLTTTEAAIYLKIKARTLLLWARQGKVKGYMLSGVRRHVWRFRRIDLDATLEVPSVHPEERMVQ